MTQEQIAALQALLGDIEAMQEAPDHYGAFSQYIEGEDGVTIQWPNLDISVEYVRKAFAKELAG